MDIFKEILGNIAGGRVLDIATSRGGFIEQLQENLASYDTITGVDIDADILETAKNKFDETSIQFIQMDAAQLGFVNGRFDTVCASAALHHLPDVPQVLDEIKRVLKPGGTFIFIEMHREAQTEAQRTIVQMHHWAADVDTARGIYHNKTFMRQELGDFIERLALQNLVIHDFARLDSDPADKEAIKHCQDTIERVLQRAIGLPKYASFKVRGEELRECLLAEGVQWEPLLFVTGQKPYA